MRGFIDLDHQRVAIEDLYPLAIQTTPFLLINNTPISRLVSLIMQITTTSIMLI